jgi:hypothetical protein
VGCRGPVLVQPRRVQAALGALGSRASTTPSGAILGADRELCDLRAVHGRPAGLAAQTLEPHPLPVDEQVTVRSPERGDARRDGARFVRVEVRRRQPLGLDLRPS